VTSKTCAKCKMIKPTNEFHRHWNSPGGLQSWCKACKADGQRTPERRAAISKRSVSPEGRRKTMECHLRRKYGITEDYRQSLHSKQNGLCANPACGTLLDLELGKRGADVDHCHKTGKVRGLLCGPCNRSLGAINDNTSKLRGLIQYLEGHQC